MQNPEPRDEHRWLEKLVGEWRYEMDAPAMEPEQPPTKHTGTESVRSVGGLWVVLEGRGDGPDEDHVNVMTLGYDPARERFVGTFLGSMMTHLWVYEGTLDADGRGLTLDTEGPSFTNEGEMARYRDRIEWRSNDHRVLSSVYQDADGAWQPVMEMHYHRVG